MPIDTLSESIIDLPDCDAPYEVWRDILGNPQALPLTLPQRMLQQRAEARCPVLAKAVRDLSSRAVEVARTGAKRRNNADDAKLAEVVELIALNLFDAKRTHDDMAVAVPCGKPWFSSTAEPRNPILAYRPTMHALEALEALGLAERVVKGSPLGGTYNLFRATETLMAALSSPETTKPGALITAAHYEPIVLRGEKGEKTPSGKRRPGPILSFEDTPEIAGMRERLALINAVNTPERIRLPDLTRAEATELLKRIDRSADEDAGVEPPDLAGIEAWFARTQLYRVFNNGIFGQGGRFYGARWQTLGEEWRERILIDGEPCVELDFVALHPRMAFHVLVGLEAPPDPYKLLAPIPRKPSAKTILNSLLNMSNGIGWPPDGFDEDDAGMPWTDAVRHAKARLPELACYFGKGVGMKLQRLDSDIAEGVMLHFARKDIPCLGVHDSFLVPRRHGAELRRIMMDAYRQRCGFAPLIDPADPEGA